MATDSPDSKLDMAPGAAPVSRAGAEKQPAGGNGRGGAATAEQAKQPATANSAATAPPAKAKSKKPAKLQPKPRGSAIEQMEELDRVGSLSLMTLAPAWLISLLIHMILLIVIGLWKLPALIEDGSNELMAAVNDTQEIVEEALELPVEVATDLDTPSTELVSVVSEHVSDTPPLDPLDSDDAPAPLQTMELAEMGDPTAPNTDLLNTIGSINGKGLSGRGDPNTRKQLAHANGGNDASEAAVAAALKWLAEHQNGDGSWCFDHRGGACRGRCKDEGDLNKAYLAATGLALLPFLGAGQTHKEGKYKTNVYRGLDYLCSHMQLSPNGGDMTGGGGQMYGHGICSIALCEAYAMTEDRELAGHAQAALNFIVYAQDPVGGGWRYSPRTPGDTSAVGWQIMALKSGYLAFLDVPKSVVAKASKFLDFVQADGGARYGYDVPKRITPATSAVGLLCRMYLGMERDNPGLERGVKLLARSGPDISASGSANIYFNYYATQVLHQYDGPDGDMWRTWNEKMRDTLIETQGKKGHETGSWFFNGDHGSKTGGRLYCTAMSAMTLEVYYRYMPIYSQESAEDGWE